MSGLGSANKVIVGNIQVLPEAPEPICHFASQLRGGYPTLLSCLSNFVSVLISSGKKKHATSFQSVVPSQDVSGYRSISVSYVRDIINVIDRSGYIEFFSQKILPFVPAIGLDLLFYPIKWLIECQEVPQDNFFPRCIVASYYFYSASHFGKDSKRL